MEAEIEGGAVTVTYTCEGSTWTAESRHDAQAALNFSSGEEGR